MRAANFVEETTTSIAGTGGNGAVTLTAVTGRPRFSTVFGTQATTIRYVIEDTTTGKFETGVGVVSANVLTRTRPQVTWDGTTYDDSTPSPLAFGSAPASGNVRVRMAASAETVGVVAPGRNQTVGGGTWKDYPITAASRFNGSGGGVVLGADQAFYSAYKLETSGALVGVQVECVTAAASAQLKLALYACGADGLPGQKIADFNAVSLATTGVKTDTATATWSPAGPILLTPGWYFIGAVANSATAEIRGDFANSQTSFTPLGRVSSYGYTNTIQVATSFASGLPALPSMSGATLSDPGGTRQSTLFIGLKVAA